MMTGSPTRESPPLPLPRAAEAGSAPFQTRPSPGSRAPGDEAVPAARQLQADGTFDYAGDRQPGRRHHAVQPGASSPPS